MAEKFPENPGPRKGARRAGCRALCRHRRLPHVQRGPGPQERRSSSSQRRRSDAENRDEPGRGSPARQRRISDGLRRPRSIANEIEAVAATLSTELAERHALESGLEVKAVASIGIACFPDYGHDLQSLLGHADTALRRVKASGRAGHAFYTAHMDDEKLAQRELERDVSTAAMYGPALRRLPAAGRRRDRSDPGLRGAAPLESSDPRIRFPNGLHSCSRGMRGNRGHWRVRSA